MCSYDPALLAVMANVLCCMPLPCADCSITDIAVDNGLPSGLVKSLTKRAERIRPFADGNFAPSPQPLLDQLTDQLLVVASDAVTAVAAAASPRLSGKATLRLLAWVVADARGAGRPMEKALAETVGGSRRQRYKTTTTIYSVSERA